MTAFGADADRRNLKVGDTLITEGDTDTLVFAVISGALDVERATDDLPIVVGSVGPGDLVGEVTNAMGGRRTATVRATQPTEVAVYTQDQFTTWLDANPDAATQIAAEARMRFNRTRASAVLVRLFELEDRDVVEAIVDEIRWITLHPGEVLFQQGDDSDAAYLLIAGRLVLLAVDESGEVVLDTEVGRGEIVGEMGIIENAPRSAGARAIRETTLALISRESFEQLSTLYPHLLLRVFHTIFDRLSLRHTPDNRARVVGLAVTAPNRDPQFLEPLVAAVEPFGSTMHIGSHNLGQFVRDVSGTGGQARIGEFLHEADVAHQYVLLESDTQVSQWSASVAKQCDRFVLFCSAHPGASETQLINSHLEQLSPAQRSSAWIVRLHAENTKVPGGSRRFLERFGVAEVHHVRIGTQRHLERVGRLATSNGRGLVLGGGGARGMAHIGALRALLEHGWQYDRIGGTSMGSVVAAFAALDSTPEQMLEAAITEFSQDLFDYTVPVVSLVKAERMSQGLRNTFGAMDIADLWLPFYAASTNLSNAQLAVHRQGSLVRAVRASVAIPVVLPPVPIDGELHVDGGVLDNVPITAMARDNSIGSIVAIDVSPPGGPTAETDYGLSVSGMDAFRAKRSRSRQSPYPELGQTLFSSMLIGSAKAGRDSQHLADLYLKLDLTGVGLLQFENHREVAERGYQSSLSEISRWLQEQSRG